LGTLHYLQDSLQQENGKLVAPASPALEGWQQESFVMASENSQVSAKAPGLENPQ